MSYWLIKCNVVLLTATFVHECILYTSTSTRTCINYVLMYPYLWFNDKTCILVRNDTLCIRKSTTSMYSCLYLPNLLVVECENEYMWKQTIHARRWISVSVAAALAGGYNLRLYSYVLVWVLVRVWVRVRVSSISYKIEVVSSSRSNTTFPFNT